MFALKTKRFRKHYSRLFHNYHVAFVADSFFYFADLRFGTFLIEVQDFEKM
jgi:hypothetical protein